MDKINDNFYFNSYSDNVPDSTHQVSILPVAFEACKDMVLKYGVRYPEIAIGIVAVLLASSNIQQWKKRMTILRPTREISLELEQNNSFSPPENATYTRFVPTWNYNLDMLRFIHLLPIKSE